MLPLPTYTKTTIWGGAVLRIIKILFLGSLFSFPVSGHASYVWSFTNSGLTYGPTDTIYLNATFTNTGSESIVLDWSSGFSYSLSWDSSFPIATSYPANPGEYNFQPTADTLFDKSGDTFLTTTILPGQSRDFVFGELIPVTSIANGTYTTASADISINNQPAVVEMNGGHFVATVVPVPAAAWLLGSGLITLFGCTRRRTPKRPAL
ncbi:MAG TPA: VPLPA-CTERM sorting domain-containing protein [Candidatus Methylomirabilis sp.]|nr:VPLPA-CTERM sorting domain-containing protein [Candidatus Methylomirabilis sp.]